ncbi:MAG: protein translocase subunit SecF [Parachlamydia sp.]|nr:protein translocase subunit SecF [Parachlamydia sp.]
MEKQKSWQFYLILAVIILTLYNILPTIFFYSQPLGSPIDAKRAHEEALTIISRVDSLEDDAKAWLHSFSRLLGVKPASIVLKESDPHSIEVTFKSAEEASLFKRFLPRAGTLIPFYPSQLELDTASAQEKSGKVVVLRQIGVHLDPASADTLFRFTSKYENKEDISPFYRELVNDRAAQLALAFGGPSKSAVQLAGLAQQTDGRSDDLAISAAMELLEIDQSIGKESPIAKRLYAAFAQSDAGNGEELIQKFLARADSIKTKLTSQIDAVLKEQTSLKVNGQILSTEQQQTLSLLESQRSALERTAALLRKAPEQYKSQKALTLAQVQEALKKSSSQIDPKTQQQVVSLEGRNPIVQALVIDWPNDRILVKFYPDVQEIRQGQGQSEAASLRLEKVNQLAINEMARASRMADETLTPADDSFAIALNTLTNTSGFLAFDLGQLASIKSAQIKDQIAAGWNPQHPDLAAETFPVNRYEDYSKLKSEDQRLGLVVYAPSMDTEKPLPGFRNGSIYIIARGLDAIIQKYRQTPEAPESQQLVQDLNKLTAILQQSGFIGYSAAAYGMPQEYSKDYIFELDDYYSALLKATRENFQVKGSKRYAVLDFSDVEQRILTRNKIEDKEQEDLLKWKEEYNAAQVDLNITSRYQVPPPTKNVYWQNFKTSFFKYFRGDDRKILKWGLDLSGGKTVRIGLRDQNGKAVTNPDDLKQAVNELYTRVNKMGVSERTIRIEGKNIILDFPGSQNLSAAELVKASAMSFHIINEKFGPFNPALKESVQQFLQNVWNEAVVTNRKDIESINEIAWQHLGGGEEERPRSESAKMLYENGLRLANLKEHAKSSAYDDTLSSIGMLRGEDYSEWDNQTHPLLVIFHNYALEGSSLNNIQVGYDPSEGNVLTFGVKRSYEGASKGSGSPRDDFYAWTSQFAEDKIAGTPKEAYSQGRGWRMAVILNGLVISNPSLRAALRDGATISGRFSQREVNQLAADLKAGSLSFTPRILSEENVSPELGQEERSRGIMASIVGLLLVVIAMVGYYHFAGIVASCAVLFNILVMWGVLQNLDAALTLPGIAGIVLTIGMAVDANVLVFERVREEFKISGRIGSAIQAGYRKAFSAIIDSNITTIMAAFILIQFDSGPIRGFAVTLIIGIISSMFTALFMTRYFFAGWVQNPKNKELKMMQFLGETHFDFLAQTKKAVLISIAVMVAGTALFFSQLHTMLGMDFTGGYAVVVDMVEKDGNPNYRLLAGNALEAHGATVNDYQIRELSRPNQLRIQLAMGMEEKGHPFYQMPEETAEGKFAYNYQSNPRLAWLVKSLEDAGLQVQPSQLETIDNNWTVMSGQFSDAMRFNALVGLGIALLSILIYITFRFEFKYAVGAVVGLLHDVIITLGILALFHKLGFPVQIDLQVVGAIMTIVGYSLNDTIIVFDRIREDIRVMRKMKFHEICNHALNVTLSRTIMTSGTTLLVLLALVLLGGKSIFAFSLVMTIGVIVGTLSSLFIATPVMIYFHDREEREEEALHFKKA